MDQRKLKGSFKKKLSEALKEDLTKSELDLLPTGFQHIGTVVILNLKEGLWRKKEIIAKAVKKIVANCESVCLNKGAITSQFRTPQIELILGKSTETIHKEHGTLYKLDVSKIMFAKGNINERKRYPKLVGNEIVFDFFAGIGYFSLNIARFAHPKKIYAFELNPIAYRYLVENIKINNVSDKIIPILGDCKSEALKIEDKADRIIMGLLPSPKDALPTAFQVINENSGIIHYEGILGDKDLPDKLLNDVISAGNKYGRKVLLEHVEYIKSYRPHVMHVCLDILIK
ncbi:MAG: class I SAM-dependent methyltransferase [Candidatus Helarchaeota archaeon]